MRTGTMGKLLSLDARGKFGYSGGFGRIAFGYTRLGFYNWYCGIYQKRYYYGKPYISKSKFYSSTGGNTLKQINNRAVLAYMWVLWAFVDQKIKEKYKINGAKIGITGANFFMSEWLKTPTSGFGSMLLGYNGFGLSGIKKFTSGFGKIIFGYTRFGL
jgi:hypothetical protein